MPNVLSVFDTPGVWKIRPHGLVHNWLAVKDFTPTQMDVPFWFGARYHMSMDYEEREKFRRDNGGVEVTEIIEYFREPINDFDSSFKGRTYLIMHFDNIAKAMLFYMKGDAIHQ